MNYKRKRPKKYVLRDCAPHCKYDGAAYKSINGRERYLPMYWKHLGGRLAWRYMRKNADPYPPLV